MIPYGEEKWRELKCYCFLCRSEPKTKKRSLKKRARRKDKKEISSYGPDYDM